MGFFFSQNHFLLKISVPVLVPHINRTENLVTVPVLEQFQFQNQFDKSDPVPVQFLLIGTGTDGSHHVSS
jgi:hypothetical protein